MDSGGYVLLFIVAACVIALIYISRKQKDLDDGPHKEGGSSGGSPDGGTGGSPDGGTPVKHIEEAPSGPPQNTLYEFHIKSAKHRCPFCDGENSAGARVCDICGRNL